MSFRKAFPEALYQQVTTAHPHRFRDAGRAGGRQIRIGDGWGLGLARSCGSLARLGAQDFMGLMKTTFGLRVHSGKGTAGIIEVSVGDFKAGVREHYRLSVEPGLVRIEASDDEAAMRGLFHLGRQMLDQRGPFLEKGHWTRRPRWSLRITCPLVQQSKDEPADHLRLPASYLTNMARYGYNATYLYIDWFDYMSPEVAGPLARPGWEKRFDELRKATDYLGGFGIRILFHINTMALKSNHQLFRSNPKMRGAQTWQKGMHCLCSSSPEVLTLFHRAAAELFTRAPKLGGIVLITGGECLLHCYTRPFPRSAGGTNCPRCRRHEAVQVVADAVNAIGRGAWESSPEARVLMWPYSAFTWASEAAQKKLLQQVDRRIGSLVTFEKDDWHTIDGTRSYLFDYSLTNLGPSKRFEKLQAVARTSGLKTFAKTETAQTIEIWNLPRNPAMKRWAQRFRALSRANLDGIHASWRFYGFCNQRNDEIVDYFNWSERPKVDEILQRMARRDFGLKAAPRVIQAWDHFSRTMARFPYGAGITGFPYWKGPFKQGPAHPFVFDLTMDHGLSHRFFGPDPSAGEGHVDSEQNAATFQPYFFVDLTWTQPFGADTMKRRLRQLDAQWQKGVQCIESARGRTRGVQRTALDEERDIAMIIGCMFRTARNLVEFQLLRDQVTRCPSTLPRLRKSCQQAVAILKDELVNAQLSLEIVQRDPRIGYGTSYGTNFDADLIQQKIDHTHRQINEGVPGFYSNHAFHMFASDEDFKP